MKKILVLFIVIASTLVAGICYGKDKNSELEKAIRDEIFDDGKEGGKGKNGKGRPDNPGAHGRANAEYKKATNPGKGGGKNSSWEDALGDILDDDDDEKGDRGNDKDKDKDKNKNKHK